MYAALYRYIFDEKRSNMERRRIRVNFSEAWQRSKSRSTVLLQPPVFDERCEELVDTHTGDKICFFCPQSANFLMMMCGCDSTVSAIAIKGDMKCNVSVMVVKGVWERKAMVPSHWERRWWWWTSCTIRPSSCTIIVYQLYWSWYTPPGCGLDSGIHLLFIELFIRTLSVNP